MEVHNSRSDAGNLAIVLVSLSTQYSVLELISWNNMYSMINAGLYGFDAFNKFDRSWMTGFCFLAGYFAGK